MPDRRSDLRRLAIVAAVSGIYDIALGLALLAARKWLQSLFALPPPAPPIHADLNGVFLLAVGIGYVLPYRRPDAYRGYLWVMGPLLKGGGSLLFLADHWLRGSPAAFLLFAVADGSLAVGTVWALLSARSEPAPGITRSPRT
jgi:xanthosine utilization system XapX-like protein